MLEVDCVVWWWNLGSCYHLHLQLHCIYHFTGANNKYSWWIPSYVILLSGLIFTVDFIPSFVGDCMDWPAAQGLLLCWRHSLGILWCSDPFPTKQYELCDVHSISIHWHSKCTDDGMTWFLILGKTLHCMCLSLEVHFYFFNIVRQIYIEE